MQQFIRKFAQSSLAVAFALFAANGIAQENPAAETTAPTAATTATTVTTATTESATSAPKNLQLLNINTASAAEIQDKMVGIGAKKAQAIVDYRTKNGAFVSVEQLTEVSGIGKATLDKNRALIVLQ